MTIAFFVSHNGDDLNSCANWTMSCRTVRRAVTVSTEGDQIFIDYGQGMPYMECENLKNTTFSIEVTKSLSFHGINGKPEIRCDKWYGLFSIISTSFNVIRVNFFNLVISNSNIVARINVGTRSALLFQDTLVKNNLMSIYSKCSFYCSILISNSSFEHNLPGGIRLQCFNVIAQIISSTFKLNPVFFANIEYKSPHLQNMTVLVQSTVVDGESTQTCVDMFAIQSVAATLNVTITDSHFKNHIANCRPKDEISALHMYGRNSNIQKVARIFLSNLSIENNYNHCATLYLALGYNVFTDVEVILRDSTFRNNSAALRVKPYIRSKHSSSKLVIFLENNTFVENIYKLLEPNAASIYFERGKSHVSSCRFFNNKAGGSPYAGVVTISEHAVVTFFNSYFENYQTDAKSNQLFASGDNVLRFTGNNTFNLIALKERQSVFIRIPTAMSAGAVIKKDFHILCPQGFKINPQRRCVNIQSGIICYYIDVECEQCPRKTYTLERGELIFNTSNNIQCKQCPRGGDCDSGLVTARPTFWGYKYKLKIVFVQCLPGYCCESEDCVTYNSCHGHRLGTLCGQCPEETSESLFSTQCISSTKCSLNYFFVLGIITLLVLYLIFFLYHKEIVDLLRRNVFSKRLLFLFRRRNEEQNTDGNASSSSGTIKIFFYYYQVCDLLRNSVRSPNESGFTQTFENAIFGITRIVLVHLPSLNCPFKNLRPVPKIVLLHSVGYCLLAFLCLLYMLSKLFVTFGRLKRAGSWRRALRYVKISGNQERSPSKFLFSQRLASAFTYISLLMYASSAQLCFSLLHCVPVGGDNVLLLDGSIQCYQTFQYFFLAYMISSILPFCLVSVLGSYVLKLGRIGVMQYCAACIFPLPFCCFWTYLLLKSHFGNRGTTIEQNSNRIRNEQRNSEIENLSGEDVHFVSSEENVATPGKNASAILSILLGPFRSHQTFVFCPASPIPWEGFLTFRRLVLIIVLTFVYDIQLRLFVALIVCVMILIVHTFVYPFQRKRDNVLESFSLGAHVVLCGSTLIKTLYFGEEYSFSKSLPLLWWTENVLIVAPLSIIMIVIILCIVARLAFCLKFCTSALIQSVRRLAR